MMEISELLDRIMDEVARTKNVPATTAVRELAQEISKEAAKLQGQVRLLTRIVDRLPLCPNHRDKVRDTCCWCDVETLRRKLEEGTSVQERIKKEVKDGR